MRAAVFGIAMGLIMGTSALAQEDKSSANYMLPYCRAAVNNQSPTLTIDAVLQGMCVGMLMRVPAGRARIPQLSTQ
jgi:hypothetical protein